MDKFHEYLTPGEPTQELFIDLTKVVAVKAWECAQNDGCYIFVSGVKEPFSVVCPATCVLREIEECCRECANE